MRRVLVFITTSFLAGSASLSAQRRFRAGPTISSLAIEDASGSSKSFTGYGGTLGLVTGDDGESAFLLARYPDLTPNECIRELTLYALDSYYYPVGTRGVAPFASTELGLARVSESLLQVPAPLTGCGSVSTSSEFALGFGLGVRFNAGPNGAALIEGRFFQVPNTTIQSLEARANVSVAFGNPRKGEFLEGTVGPAAGFLIPVSGPLRARGPMVGARFRRDTKRAGSVVGLDVLYAPLHVTTSCPTPGCDPDAIMFAPGFEPSLRPVWGRVYVDLGLLIAGFYTAGPDRGVAQGLHGGLGVDLYSGRLMWNVNSRLLWLQRNSRENVFGVQVGASLSPKIGR